MADGYYRASGKVAAVCTSIGPGATNTLTGLATAFADSQPLLLLTGAVHTYMENRGVLQEIDRPHGNNFPRMAEPVVKRWWQPNRVESIPTALAQAFNTMHEGRRGPVLVDIPQDLQAEYGEYSPPGGRPSRRDPIDRRPGRHRGGRSIAGGGQAPGDPGRRRGHRRRRRRPNCSHWPSTSAPRSPTPSRARARSPPTTSCTHGHAATWARSPATR